MAHVRVQHADGASIDVHRSGPYPAPYVFDVIWPSGRVEQGIAPDSNTAPNRESTAAYARTYVREVVASQDY